MLSIYYLSKYFYLYELLIVHIKNIFKNMLGGGRGDCAA